MITNQTIKPEPSNNKGNYVCDNGNRVKKTCYKFPFSYRLKFFKDTQKINPPPSPPEYFENPFSSVHQTFGCVTYVSKFSNLTRPTEVHGNGDTRSGLAYH